ncbi:MAG: hypothetical protein ABIK65_12485 [Candidatus Eisenbacteria bacterium]
MASRRIRACTIALFLLLSLGTGASGRDLRSEPLRYDFSGGDPAGWGATGGLLRAGPGGLRLDGTEDATAALISPGGLEIDGERLDRVEVRIATEPAGTGAVLYWTDDEARGFVAEWRAEIPDGRTVVRLGENPSWRGRIDRFLISPGRGARSLRLEAFEVRRAEGIGEILGDGWTAFGRTELRSHYSVNGILGASVGKIPYSLLLGVLFVLLPAALALRRRSGFAAEVTQILPRWLLAGVLLFFARSAVDEIRIARAETARFGGKSLMEKTELVNPPGFFPLIIEAKRRIPEGAAVDLRAPEPYPWEKGAFYLYPSRVRRGADYVISYRSPAPPDSASCVPLFRREGAGSVYGRRRGAP